MKSLAATVASAVVLLSCLALAAAPRAEMRPAPAPAPAAEIVSESPEALTAPITYALVADSWALHGCFQPCLCPLLIDGDMVGQFVMELTEQTPEMTAYVVTDIVWDVYDHHTAAYLYTITGSGTYEVRTLSEGGQTQRMTLTLVYNELPHLFDSGEAALDPGQPFAILISDSETECLKDAFLIQAAPAEPPPAPEQKPAED